MLDYLNRSYIYSVIVSILICIVFYLLNKKNKKVSFLMICKLFLSSFVVTMGGYYTLTKVLKGGKMEMNVSQQIPVVNQPNIMTGYPNF